MATLLIEPDYPEEVNVRDFGACGDGVTNDFAAIQAALDSGAQRVTVPAGVFVIRNVLRPAAGQHVVIHGTLRVAAAEMQLLTDDVKIGDSEIRVRDASGFAVGEWVTLHDDRLPIQGGGRKTRHQNAGNARIVSISKRTLHLDRQSARSYQREANGVVARQHNAIWIQHSGVRISGGGVIDGNYSRQLNTAPGLLEKEASEDWRVACGIVALGDEATSGLLLSDIIIEDVTVQDTTMMGIMLVNAERSVIRNTTVLRSHDKNIILWCCRDCRITGNTCCDSGWEDGIMLHQVRDEKYACYRIMIEGNTCKNNARYGLHVGANHRQVHLANNLCVDNGLNLSIYGDNCTSTGDVAVGTTDRLFTADVYRPNVLIAGRHISVVNLTALGTRFVGLELCGTHLSILGGLVGEMEDPLPETDNGGIQVEEGGWGKGSGEFWIKGDCRIGLGLVPGLRGGRQAIVPTNIRVSGVQIHGCRVGVKVHEGATGIDLSDNQWSDNVKALEMADSVRTEVHRDHAETEKE